MIGAGKKRPYWFRDASLESGVYLGITKGEWPIRAFAADLTHHITWVAENPDRILIGPIPMPEDVSFLTARVIPAETVLEPYE